MLYEFHVTVKPVASGIAGMAKWVTDCENLAIKPLIIRLSHGDYPEQFMCSVTIPADWIMAQDYAKWLASYLRSMGYEPNRTKIEIPLYEYNIFKESTGKKAIYHETHIKLTNQDLPALFTEISQYNRWTKNPMAFSHSLLKGNVWLTQRADADSFADVIFENGRSLFKNTTFHNESVVMDTCPTLDKGWI